MTFITKQSEKHVQANDRCTLKKVCYSTDQLLYCYVDSFYNLGWPKAGPVYKIPSIFFSGVLLAIRDGAVASDSPNPESRLYFRPISLRQMYGTPQDFYVKNERYQLLA